MRKILEDRLISLSGLDGDIDISLKDKKLEISDKDDIAQFEIISNELQSYIRDYKESLEQFLNAHQEFSYVQYQVQFKEKDDKMHNLLQEYVSLRSKL